MALPPDATAAAGLGTVLGAYRELMLANEPGVISDRNPDCLHDFRVALRSLRSVFNELRGVVPKPARRRLRQELALLSKATSPQRDLDMLESRLPHYLHAVGVTAAEAPATALRATVNEARQREHIELVRHLQSQPYRAFERRLAGLLRDLRGGAAGGKRGGRPLKPLVDEAIAHRFDAILARNADGAHDDLRRLHALRKTCKKLRYLIEGFQSLYPPATVRRAVAELKTLQTAMGEYWDLRVHRDLLHGHATTMTPACGFAAIDDFIEQRQTALVAVIEKRLRAYRRKANRRLYAELVPDLAR